MQFRFCPSSHSCIDLSLQPGDARGGDETLKQIERDNDVLAQHARAESAKDPQIKGLKEAARTLDDLMVLVKDSSKAALKEPKDKRSYGTIEQFATLFPPKTDIRCWVKPIWRSLAGSWEEKCKKLPRSWTEAYVQRKSRRYVHNFFPCFKVLSAVLCCAKLSRAAADLDEIVPRLREAYERVNKNPKDRKALEELEEVITRSQFPLEVIGMFT